MAIDKVEGLLLHFHFKQVFSLANRVSVNEKWRIKMAVQTIRIHEFDCFVLRNVGDCLAVITKTENKQIN